MNSQVSFVRDYDSDSDCVIVAEFDAPSASDAGVATICGRIVPDENFVSKEENSAEDEAAHIDPFAFLEMAIYDDASTPVASYSEDNGSINSTDAVAAYVIPPPQGFDRQDNPLDRMPLSSDTPRDLTCDSKGDVPLYELRNRSRSMSPSFHGFSEERFAAHPFLHYFEALQRLASPPFIGLEPSECFIHKIKEEKFSAAGLSRFGDQNIIVEAESNDVYVQESWQPVVRPEFVERERMTVAKYHRTKKNVPKNFPSRSSHKIDTREPRKKSARANKSSKTSETATDCISGP
ncbi:hypothetical protein QAD02_003669 [Eretmocerus hayati]|uniref:Uncharacterized protein n=1 Tax=Eretmocerus hayati TaxID=131215 RepID=A0ACC2NMN3_9HYME|nr:hypothetical protein QAD02_003669 [Eretmocerus hayati]